MEVHVVQKGDTLWKISRQYGISFEELKRVNAHLANPDYVVPGMKIFLPDQVKKPSTGAEHVKKTEKAPVKKPTSPKEEVEVPKQPKPLPEVPTPPKVPIPPVESKPAPPKPQPKPEPKPQPKPKPEQSKPKPTPPKEPVSPPIQSQPMPPPQQPMQPYPAFSVIGIPCGWLPIYDADCYPHMHPSQMHPMPAPMPQLPVQLESSHFPGHHLPIQPKKPKITDDWKMIESPMIEEEFTVQQPTVPEPRPAPQPTPERIPIPLPQAVEPMQNSSGGCMHCGGQQSHPGHALQCGCGSFQPMAPMMPMPPMPQHHGHCNACNQPIHRMPQMMPFPNPNNNWYGTH